MDREQKRFDIAMDVVKQQINLAAGIIAILVALNKGAASTPILVSVVSLICSIILGVLMLLAIPYALYDPDRDPFSEYRVRFLGASQVLLFLLGIVFLGLSV